MSKRMFPTLAEQIADKCVHFTGTMNKTCRAGVAYATVEVKHEPMPYKSSDGHEYTASRSLPCNHRLNHCGAACASSRFPTPEEVEAEVAKSNREVERVVNSRQAIVDAIEATGQEHGAIDCPSCAGGSLTYRRASNGHIWARCSTEDCVAWME